MATASESSCEGLLQLLRNVGAHCTLTATPTSSSHRGTLLYETYVEGQRNLDVYMSLFYFLGLFRCHDSIFFFTWIWKNVSKESCSETQSYEKWVQTHNHYVHRTITWTTKLYNRYQGQNKGTVHYLFQMAKHKISAITVSVFADAPIFKKIGCIGIPPLCAFDMAAILKIFKHWYENGYVDIDLTKAPRGIMRGKRSITCMSFSLFTQESLKFLKCDKSS